MNKYDDIVVMIKDITTNRCRECIHNEYHLIRIKSEKYTDIYEFYNNDRRLFILELDYESNRYRIKSPEMEPLSMSLEAAYTSFILANGIGLYTRFIQH